jgi:hypothetical protein
VCNESARGVLGEPRPHGGRAVRRRIVEDDVQLLTRILASDFFHEAEKVGAGAALLAAVSDLAVCNVESGKQIYDTMAFVIVCVPCRAA